MQFTKLRLQGFKSFVDPTDLAIMDGLTGVVGPNGCGKSNLLEALRWVMGENRPTQMRGGGMEDVIFAGTTSRAPKHFAEVSLFVDNKDRQAPAAFNQHDELDILRRITRDIGSAYKVNGKDVRARDVTMMFADAATGSHSPSLVRQGQISELINAKPQARRRVLEDAAGISGLYQRRHEAELKLNSAESNLLRVDDVLEQLAAQMRSLERQAKAAKRYREISADLRAAEALRAFIIWQMARDARLAAENNRGELRTKRSEAERARLQTEKALQAAQEALPAKRDEEAIAGAVLQRLTLAKDNLEEEEARLHASIAELAKTAETLARDQLREGQIEKDASDALARLLWEEGQITETSQGEEEAILAASETARIGHDALGVEEAKFDDMRQELAREEARAQAAERRYAEAQNREKSAATALAKVKAEQGQVSEEALAAERDLAEKEKSLQDLQTASAGFEAQISDAREKADQASDSLNTAQSALAEASGALSALEAEKRGLMAMLDRAKSDSPALDFVEVQKGYEAAMGAGFEDTLEAPIAEDRTGWTSQSPKPSPSWPNGATPLGEFVKAPDALHNRIKYIAVIEALGAGMIDALAPGQRLVTKTGDLYRWDGFVRLAEGGENAAALLLQQRNRLKEIAAEIATLSAKKHAAEARIEAAKTDAADAKRNLQSLSDRSRQAERAVTEAIRAFHASENTTERIAARREMLASALAHREEEFALAMDELQEASGARIDISAFDAQKTALEEQRIKVEDARRDMLEKRAAVEEMRKAREHRQKRLGDIAREKTSWQKRIENTAQHQSDLVRRIAENEEARKKAAHAPAELSQKRMLLETDISHAETRLSKAKEALAEAESLRARSDQAHREAERALADIREALARAELAFETAEAHLTEAANKIETDFDNKPEALGESLLADGRDLPELSEVEREIGRLTGAREAMGAVNLRADEDRIEVEAEFTKLEADKAEITEAISKLRQAIAALNKEGRERLITAFDEVNANFKMLFCQLFGGGDASLELVESDDPLNAGLEIFCQPPGKKLATLSLLSGGEQTLTALSLIFAVFLTNPSPICVLDEVDAPLDDANVTRFCNMLDEMTRQTDTRFLIITHHAVTMARMDRLFGVTMAERGVSQLVSVDLRQAEELVAEEV